MRTLKRPATVFAVTAMMTVLGGAPRAGAAQDEKPAAPAVVDRAPTAGSGSCGCLGAGRAVEIPVRLIRGGALVTSQADQVSAQYSSPRPHSRCYSAFGGTCFAADDECELYLDRENHTMTSGSWRDL